MHQVSPLNSIWKFLDVSEIVSLVLRARNPRARTIYWKLVFCMGDNSSKGRGSELPASWLRSKLIRNLEGNTVACYISSNVENKAATRRRVGLLLQLHRLYGDKISSWIVLLTTGKSEYKFYCSGTLARGIEWLATLAPAQPELHAVDLRDLVAEKLYSTLNLSREETKAGPGDYFFSKALHDATAEVTNAASTSPSHWPPPNLATSSSLV
ncbi:hypothetical protein SELMODRAFT_405626 [Selaginella moellendorffii]|uniref:Uncharacterized protein n=1 Tax=Selaginella moellendorffii TaxID=88036 RepID=D8QZ67_SELML|nr:hypothetical protein SELMODRAFT_405626 [Selaginella moellendorffii]